VFHIVALFFGKKFLVNILSEEIEGRVITMCGFLSPFVCVRLFISDLSTITLKTHASNEQA